MQSDDVHKHEYINDRPLQIICNDCKLNSVPCQSTLKYCFENNER